MSSSKQIKKHYWYLDGVSNRDLLVVVVDQAGQEISRKIVKNGSYTEKLLPVLVDLLKSKKRFLPKGIIVAQGAGGFSQLRLICATINALAFARGIRLATTPKPTTKIGKLSQYKWQKMIWPKYNGPGVG